MEGITTFDLISIIGSIICGIVFLVCQIILFKKGETEGFVLMMSIFMFPVIGMFIYGILFFLIPIGILYGLGQILEGIRDN